jgi:hypothetical protein
MALDDAGTTIRDINEMTATKADPEQPTGNHRGGLRHYNDEDTHSIAGSRTFLIGMSNSLLTCWSE